MTLGARKRVCAIHRSLSRALPVLWLASLMLVPHVLSAQDDTPDDNAKSRLEWMRQNQTGMWNISPREGLYLYDLIVKHHLKSGLEIGTSNGYSGIWIASAMAVTGGHLLTLEINEERAKLAQENFHAAAVEAYVTIDHADALEEIPKLSGPYDFVFIDAWKDDYVKYLDLVIPRLSTGGMIVAHNVKDMAEELHAFIERVKTDRELKTTFADPGPGGYSISIKRRTEE
jgi:caffeoyl-CoA O-methyltransferase